MTDKDLIESLKESHPMFFTEVGLSVLVLRRYDHAISKMSFSEIKAGDYLWWITTRSSKPIIIEKQSPAILQMTKSADMAICRIYVDNSVKSNDLINIMKEI